jgi:DNA processing protein
LEEQEAWLRLKLIPGLGNAGIIRLLQGLNTPQAILHASVSALTSFVSPSQATNIVQLQTDITPAVTQHQNWLLQPDNHLITLADEDYPRSLLDLPDPPALLFAKGKRTQLQSYIVAIIGSRNPTEQGVRHARDFAKTLSQIPLTIISGLAAGIDAAAHEGALLADGKTIAVVGTGLDIVYPSRNRALAHVIAQEGLLLSEFTLGTSPKPAHFPSRNRLIAALSKGCLIVEAALQSGSLITAKQALELGREVFAIPGSIHSPLSKGCHALIKSGAKLVESIEDILGELHLSFNKASDSPHAPLKVDPIHHKLLTQMGYDPISLDDLARDTGDSVDKLSALLLLLEVDGHVTCLSDGRYQRCI